MRKLVRISIFDQEEHDGDWPAGSLPDAIAWFQEKLEAIPPEFRESSKVVIDSDAGWESSHYGHIQIWYERAETEEETRAREREDDARREREIAREMATLRHLKAKYEQ